MTDRHDMPHGDPASRLEGIFGEPVESLPAPPGRFEQIVVQARRRRRRRAATVALSGAAAAVVAAVAVSSVVGLGHETTLAGPSSARSSSRAVTGPTDTPSPAPSRSASALASVQQPSSPTATSDGLPPGGPVPAGFRPQSASTASNDVVYLLGDAPCDAAPCTSLVRTTDGGRSWRGVPAPRVAIATAAGAPAARPDAVSQVRFADPRDGWAFGGGLWSTHDAAASTASWRKVDVGGAVLDLATDGRTVWALVADCGTDGTCSGARLLRSPVGRDEFHDADRVYVKGRITGARLQLAGGAGTLTVDGDRPAFFVLDGDRWRQTARPCPQGGAVVPTAAAPAALVALCPTDPGAGSVTYTTSRSTDLGRTWTAAAGALRVPNGQAEEFAAASAQDLAAAVGSPDLGGGLWVSQDGGRSWAPGPGLPRLTTGWAWVGAAGGGRYLAVPFDPTGALWESRDGGRTWRALAPR